MKKLFSILVLCICMLICFAGCGDDNNNGGNASNSAKFDLSDAYDYAERELRREIGDKFGSSANIEIASKSYNMKNDDYQITFKGKASGYTGDYNAEFNQMTFTFRALVAVSESGQSGWCYNTYLDYDWKY